MADFKKSDAMIFAIKAVLEEGYIHDVDMFKMIFTLSELMKEYKRAIHWEKEIDKLREEEGHD